MLGIESIAPDPSDSNRVYIATGTYTNDWAGNGAILRSSDKGDNWLRTDLPFKNGGNEDGRGMGERLVVHPRDSKTIFFGTRRNGLWKSSDFGATWNKVAAFPALENENGIGISFLTFDASGALYAGVASKTANLYVSTDNGVTWKTVAGAPQGFFPHHGVFASDGTFYLTYSNGPGPNGVTDGAVWKRSGAGQWTNISPIHPDATNGFGFAGLGVDAQNPQALMVSTLDRWAKGDDIFRSIDGGATWKSVSTNSERDSSAAPYLDWGKEKVDLGHWIGDVEIDPFNSGHALYTTGATIWGTDNVNDLDNGKASNWSVRAGGIEEVSVSKLISPPVGPHLVSGMRDIGGFVHDDLIVAPRGGMMSNPRLSRNEGLDYAALKPTLIVRVGDGKGGYSTDSGKNWILFAGKPAENMEQGPIAVSADGTSWVWSAQEGNSYYSTDSGTTWNKSTGLHIKAKVVSDRVKPNVFYAVNTTTKRLLISTDGGANFSPNGAVIPEGVSRLSAGNKASDDLWLVDGSGLVHSTNGGVVWSKIGGVEAVDALGFDKAAPNADYDALFIAGKVDGVHGLFRSDFIPTSLSRASLL